MRRAEAAARWAAGQGPGGDYVLTGAGDLTPMTVRSVAGRVVTWSPGEVIDGEPEFGWSELVATCRAEQNELRALAGESSSWGGIGWIAVEHKKDSRLLWVATSNYSNPFHSVRLDGGLVEAVSTFGQSWRLRLSAPTNVVISGIT